MLNPNTNRKRERHFLIDGYALELWAVKTLLATHVGGILKWKNKATRDCLDLDIENLLNNIFSDKIIDGIGIYFHDEYRATKNHVSYKALSDGVRILGIRIQLMQFGFDCVISERSDYKKDNYRPRAAIYWNKKSILGFLHIAWDGIAVGDWVYTEELD